MKKVEPLDWALLAGLVVAWGSSFAVTKIAVGYMSAEWIVALRLCVASLILVPWAYFKQQLPEANRKKWGKYFWLGAIGNSIPFFLISWGAQFVSSGISGLLMGSIPLMIVVFAHFVLPEEKLNVPKLIGFALGFVGVIVLLDPNTIINFKTEGMALVGELAILLGCLSYAIHSIEAKRLGIELPFRQSAGVILCGAALSLVFALMINPSGLNNQPISAYLATIGLGILPTAIAALIMYKAIERAGPSFVSMSNYLVPVFALVAGAIVLGETLEWKVFLSLAFILGGIAVSRMSGKKPA